MSTTLTLDKAGRIVLPKPIRDRLHLRTGSRLRLDVSGDKMEITAETEPAKIVKRGKRRVIVGWDGFDAAKAVKNAREEQLERLDAPLKK